MKQDFEIEQTNEGVLLVRENVENLEVKYVAGLSTADPENYNRPREREAYLEKVLNPAIRRGEIGDGIKSKFDDRKFRFHAANLDGGRLEIQLGITYYQECADCRKWCEEKRAEMTTRGKEIFGEPCAFFTRGCGIGVIPITSEGNIFVGKRQTEDNSYLGELAAINGWVDYKDKLEEVDFSEDALRELEEEFGILEKDIDKLIFSEVVSDIQMANTDFVYLASLRINNKTLLDRFRKRRDEEHGKLIKIASYKDMQRLLETGRLPGIKEEFNLLYSLRASLEQIRPEEMA